MVHEETRLEAAESTASLPALAAVAFRSVAAMAAVICACRLYCYFVRSGMLDAQPVLSGAQPGKLLYAGPSILVVILKLSVSLLVLGSLGWGLAGLVRWAASGLRNDPEQ
jgi:hypothetical protein